MPRSDAILERLLSLHPKAIDLSLGRIERLLARLGHPERALPPVIHVAGTNGKGSVIANLRAMLEAAGAAVHVYTSPHLVRFHERIRLGRRSGPGELIGEDELCALLEECEAANGAAPITFFEITTAAAFLAFARHPADMLLLEVGLGGRLDATNVIERPALTVITSIDIDHQQYLGEGVEAIAREKAGILRAGVPCVLAPQADAVRAFIGACAAENDSPLLVGGEHWQVFEQHGRLIYQDATGLLDLPLPRLAGRFQLENAGTALAALRTQTLVPLEEADFDAALAQADWPGRLVQLKDGLVGRLPDGAELWLDGGHNPAAGAAVSASLADLEDRVSRPLVLIVGMINSKDVAGFLEPFVGLAQKVVTLTIPGEENAVTADELAAAAEALGLVCETATDLDDALQAAALSTVAAPRVLICGSLYLAGHVLAQHDAEPV